MRLRKINSVEVVDGDLGFVVNGELEGMEGGGVWV